MEDLSVYSSPNINYVFLEKKRKRRERKDLLSRKPFCRKCGSKEVIIKDAKMICYSCKETFTWEVRPVQVASCGFCDGEITIDVGGWKQDSSTSWASDPFISSPHAFQLCQGCKDGLKGLLSKKKK